MSDQEYRHITTRYAGLFKIYANGIMNEFGLERIGFKAIWCSTIILSLQIYRIIKQVIIASYSIKNIF